MKIGDIITIGCKTYEIKSSSCGEPKLSEVKPVTYSMGNLIKICGCIYIICRCGDGKITLASITNGNQWSNPLKVSSAKNITEAELKVYVGSYDFELVKGNLTVVNE